MKRPASGSEIAAAARDALQAAVPALQGRAAFDARVAARMLGALQRELDQGAVLDAAERASLQTLLPEASQALPLDALREQLCESIAGGGADPPALLQHLWRTALAQLAIDSPAYRWRAALPAPEGEKASRIV